MGFNSGLKGLIHGKNKALTNKFKLYIKFTYIYIHTHTHTCTHTT
jgi:hypothetical protein